MTKADLLKRIDSVLAKGGAVINSVPNFSATDAALGFTPDTLWVAKDAASAFRTAGSSA